MSFSLPEISGLRIRISELVDLIAAHDKFVKTFLVPIAQAGIDDCNYARAVVHPPSPGPHPGMDSIEDAGLALVREKEGKAMLALYEADRAGLENMRQRFITALSVDNYLTAPTSKQSVKNLQTTMTKACRDKARALIAKLESTMGQTSVGEVEDRSEAFRMWSDDNLEDEEAYIRSALKWSSENPDIQ
ncbi:hypothetical protein HBH70_157860 [Parastagonospora nodorum]|nr:hypothetical protein HBH53_123010 [Parastagonospora nodorum]KAH3973648.1 hypothetical protein HBH51_096200 [Parastagonospora nodorum]KAH4050478.1 hypothetical protein HBH49_132980 [Parastagonospora nodorum]KAH4118970.1 hypothetical protein HBH47_133260 [Parastagonospora nodorum]KAH4601564.1 hypothetical protein HBH82_173760 [Parastagonospora nodorum]